MTFVLLHSPLLGPASWEPVAALLPEAVVPDLRGVAEGGAPYWPAAVELVTRQVPPGPLVLVPHSNAGLFVPLLCRALEVSRCVFVDALLPPAAGQVAAAKDEHLPFLRKLADLDGLLPRWTDWWLAEDVASLFPDRETRERVSAEQVRLPLDYFEQAVPVPEGWDARPCAYLWYGPPYEEDARAAAARGWQVERLPGHHLHHLVDPGAVAERLLKS
ncbi:alpha/beta hydrolase [Thermoactinospora rubra]|uniref:alpha/beta hydrolase n=1 Tax=Thermoactinospora rubra TaxID=1088767 RepID=UPI00117D8A30|nr:alpha/beta hydrolase [Thermoactinospora rubra]